MGGSPKKVDRGREGGAPPALQEPGEGAPPDPPHGAGWPAARGMPGMQGSVSYSRPAVPWRAPPGGAAMQGRDMLLEARAFAAGEEAAAVARRGRGRMSAGAVLIKFQLALGRIKDSVSSPLSALNWIVQHASALDAAALAEDPMGAISGIYGWAQGRFGYILRLVLPRALVYVLEKIFPNLARGAAAGTPAERATVKLAGSPRLLKMLFRVPGFTERALSMGTEHAFAETTTAMTDSEVASGHLDFERGIETIADVTRQYRGHVHDVNVAVEATKEPYRGARGGSPARHDALASSRLLAEQQSAKDSRLHDVIDLFVFLKHLLDLWRIVDGNVHQELVAYALQLALVLLKLFAG